MIFKGKSEDNQLNHLLFDPFWDNYAFSAAEQSRDPKLCANTADDSNLSSAQKYN